MLVINTTTVDFEHLDLISENYSAQLRNIFWLVRQCASSLIGWKDRLNFESLWNQVKFRGFLEFAIMRSGTARASSGLAIAKSGPAIARSGPAIARSGKNLNC